jgi:predicted nucleotidyltransferase
MNAQAGAFTEELEQAFGPRLRSVVLHGSVARGEAVKGVSDVNLLVLLDDVDATALRTAGPLARRWARAGNTAPLLFSWDEWVRSADAFAIEVADMKDARRVLHGEDPLADLDVSRRELRLQAERELRGKLVQLRSGLLLTAERPAEVGRLLLAALPSFTTYARAVVRLHEEAVPDATPAVLDRAGALVEADAAPLHTAWQARTTGGAHEWPVDSPLVRGYYSFAEHTADHVDRLPEV